MLLTVEQAAERLQLHPETVRRQLKRGELRAIKRGRVWRVPESALTESTAEISTPQTRAAAILAAFDSGDMKRRNAAIIELARADAATNAIVDAAAAKAVEEYDGPEDDFSAWQNVDLKPHFPDEAPDYLDGLYRADKNSQATSDEETA